KTRVGWWKNGYPEYFAKVLNAANWIGIDIRIGEETLDLYTAEVSDFKRVLNMKEGYLERTFTAKLQSGKMLQVCAKRFCSIVDDEAAAIQYSLKALNFDDVLTIIPYIDGDVQNQDSNYDEKFWDEVYKEVKGADAYLTLRTKKTAFDVCTATRFSVDTDQHYDIEELMKEK